MSFMLDTGRTIGTPCWTYTIAGHSPSEKITWHQSGFDQGHDHPVVCIGWDDAQAYTKWLSRKREKCTVYWKSKSGIYRTR